MQEPHKTSKRSLTCEVIFPILKQHSDYHILFDFSFLFDQMICNLLRYVDITLKQQHSHFYRCNIHSLLWPASYKAKFIYTSLNIYTSYH